MRMMLLQLATSLMTMKMLLRQLRTDIRIDFSFYLHLSLAAPCIHWLWHAVYMISNLVSVRYHGEDFFYPPLLSLVVHHFHFWNIPLTFFSSSLDFPTFFFIDSTSLVWYLLTEWIIQSVGFWIHIMSNEDTSHIYHLPSSSYVLARVHMQYTQTL